MKPSILVCAYLGTTLAAQTANVLDEPRGAFQAIPHFLCTDSASIPMVAQKAFGDHPTNFPPFAPIQFGGDAPDFSMTAMFGASAQSVEIDAMSSGNDMIPLNGSDELDPHGGHGWVAIMYSVAEGAACAGTIIDARRALPRGVGGDLYGYFLDGSNTAPPNGVPASLVGNIVLEQGSEHMGLPADVELQAFDPYLPYIAAGVGPGALMPNCDILYFSVTQASAAALTGRPGWPPSVHGADILSIGWNATAHTWGAPQVFRSHVDLQLWNEDVDALAVHVNGRIIVLSTTGAAAADQLMVSSDHGRPAVPLRRPGGTPVRLIDAGDINAVTIFDPDIVTGNPHVGWPTATSGRSPRLTLSVGSDGNEGDAGTDYVVSVSGFGRVLNPGMITLSASYDLMQWFPLSHASHSYERTVQWPLHLRGPVRDPLVTFYLRADFVPSGGGALLGSYPLRLAR
ncbi:MAG: hypothetical protein R3F56_13590 [Planctomycetota bacterium]